jgi:hypothetical protein
MPTMPLGGGAAAALDVPPLEAAAPFAAAVFDDPLDAFDVVDDVEVALATALSRRAASASRLARLRAARRCFDSWRLSGTVDNGRSAGAPMATRDAGWRPRHRDVVIQRSSLDGGSAHTMTESRDIGADSPLLPIVDATDRRARFRLPVPVPAASPAHVDGLLAGAVDVDITPPPGLPKAGYSRNAHTGTGFRSRLRARVLHVRAETGSVALVQCDLLGGSAVVQRLVARAVAGTTDIPPAGVYIGATHTHGGPGQFLGTDFYNRFASNKPGFDASWAQLLATRIAAGVVQAVEDRHPARLAWGSTEVWGLTRNRSLASHVRNREVADRRTGRQCTYVSVDPRLHLLRVDARATDGGHEPLAAMVVFWVHGTGVPMRSDVYNADLWAYVTDELGGRIERSHGRRPVVGAVEGIHAHVAAAATVRRAASGSSAGRSSG